MTDTCLIIHPVLYSGEVVDSDRDIELMLEEAEGLARAIDLQVDDVLVYKIQKPRPATLFGTGQCEAIAEIVEQTSPSVVIINRALTPGQQRNLEKELNAKIIDRTSLILEIFGARAQTKEGRIQVELAALSYQRSRLVRSWTHLERQRGGAGFMGGPGERQLELDRRIIDDRITKLKKQLETVRRTRGLARDTRAKVPFPVVALVGYTNAGKSTLFNRLTGASVFAEDLPFATLDPTLRRLMLPNKQTVILSDTVGFISDLPTQLVAAFRATLEQVTDADVILHVRDISAEDTQSQRLDVIKVLKELGVEYETDERIMEVFNKIDKLPDTDELPEPLYDISLSNRRVGVSALTGEGIEDLLKAIGTKAGKAMVKLAVEFDIGKGGKERAWLYANANITEEIHSDSGALRIKFETDSKGEGQFRSLFPEIELEALAA